MAKQLFNSSEKSNFILNLTEEGYSKMAAVSMVAACFATSVTTAIPVITGKNIYSVTAIGLILAGVFSMIVALIGAVKKFISKKLIIPLSAAGVLLLFTVISTLCSYDMRIGFYGYTGRDEGLIATVFYICFFVTAASVKTKKALKTLLYGIISVGLVNSVIGIIQVFAAKFSHYKMVKLHVQANAASGFSQSPLFLAMMLCIALCAALIGIICFKSKVEKIICTVAACLFSFIMMFTYSLLGICGAALAVIMAIVIVFAMKAPKINLLSTLTVIIPAVAAVVIVNAGVIGNISQYRLYDGYTLWRNDAHVRLSASGLPGDNVDIDSVTDVYYTLNRKTMDIISGHLLTGTGPDQLVFPQLYTAETASGSSDIEDIIAENKGTFDRVYNEYLNTAGTRGIIAAISFGVFLLSVLMIGLKSFRKQKTPESLFAVIGVIFSILLFFIGCSNTAFAPIFWTVCGCACASVSGETAKEKSE